MRILVLRFHAIFEKYFQVFGNVFDPLTTVSIRTRILRDAQMIQILNHYHFIPFIPLFRLMQTNREPENRGRGRRGEPCELLKSRESCLNTVISL